MSSSALKLLAASGAKGSATYVEDLFSTFLYNGTGASQSITNGIDLDGEGGLVWVKARASARHQLYDTERGVNKALRSASSDAQTTGADLSAFNSGGFSLLNLDGYSNTNGDKYASWTFRKQPGFFDIVTYTGNGVSDRAISHNLGSAPGFIIIKSSSHDTDWVTYHRSYTYPQWIRLNSTDAQGTGYGDAFSSGNPPTSTTFTLGSGSFGDGNYNGRTYVAYLFAHDAQDFGTGSDEAIIKCGSFTTTSTWGNFKEDLGFEPQWLMVKRRDSASDWVMLDIMRGVTGPGDQALVDTGGFGGNSNDQELKANSDAAESEQGRGGFYSQGYLGNLGGFGNATYVYIAIRRPQKPASEFAATDLFTPVSQNFAPGIIPAGFPIDFIWHAQQGSSNSKRVFDRLRGAKLGLYTNATNADVTHNLFGLDNMTGFEILPGTTIDAWSWMMFRRAPGFMDIVAYVGTGSTRTVTHNLGAVPEMMLVKNRTSAYSWSVYHSGIGATKYLTLNTDVAPTTNAEAWNDTAPTSSVFTVKDDGRVNLSNASHIAYLFASVAGISKVGSYTGTGNDLNVDCGFSAGARFVIAKRSDSTGGWYLWDSARGIVAGNDSYFLMNTDAAQVTNTDYIDPLASGFTITSSAPAELNASGGTYIFYAVA